MQRRAGLALVVGLGLMVVPRSSHSDPLTLALFFSGLNSTVQQAIVDARNAGDALAIQAGRQVSLALAQAQAVYGDALEKTMDKLDATAKNNLDRLKTMVDQYSSKTFGQSMTLPDGWSRSFSNCLFATKSRRFVQYDRTLSRPRRRRPATYLCTSTAHLNMRLGQVSLRS